MTSKAGKTGRRPFSINSVDHTGITVSSLEKSLDFWVRVLGFRHLYTWEFKDNAFFEDLVGVKGASVTLAMVHGFGHQIELLQYHSPADRAAYKPRACDIGSVHVALFVDDIGALLASVKDSGWQVVGQPPPIEGGERDGWKLAYIADPDGVLLEFIQPALRRQCVGAIAN